jgi:hypothetical protein
LQGKIHQVIFIPKWVCTFRKFRPDINAVAIFTWVSSVSPLAQQCLAVVPCIGEPIDSMDMTLGRRGICQENCNRTMSDMFWVTFAPTHCRSGSQTTGIIISCKNTSHAESHGRVKTVVIRVSKFKAANPGKVRLIQVLLKVLQTSHRWACREV